MIFDWVIIYNDGCNITTVDDSQMAWNQAPSDNVQFVICQYDKWRQVVSGLDEYTIPQVGALPKKGKLLIPKKWNETRQFMIYGDYPTSSSKNWYKKPKETKRKRTKKAKNC